MPSGPIAAVMVHVPSITEAFAWYQEAFPTAKRTRIEEPEFEFLTLGDTRIEIVLADDKVATGPAGSVVYWSARNFDTALAHLLQLGATLYRGPMRIEHGQRMCQVRDPWGNCFGIRGK